MIEIIEGNIKDSYYSMTIWRIGWIYYINSYYEYAIEYFESYWRTINNYALRHQFLYWKARAEEKMGWRDKAYMTYQSILNEDDWSFYSWLAKEKLGYQDDYSHPYFSDLQEEIMLQDPFSMLSEQEHSILNRIIELLILGLKEELVKEISCHAYSGKRERPQFLYSLAILAHTAGEYELGIRIGILYKNRIKDLSQDILFKNAGNALIYPLAFLDKILENSKKYQLDPVLILSIIRQESLFDPYSLSYASAYGLMQVIPSTGRSSAKELGIEFPADTASLFDTDLNLTLGCFYFKKVLNEYGNNVFHALAAYNAGPGALTKWQNRFGEMDIDEFIERIPYPETREYVKRVMKNYSVYSRLSAFSKKYSK